MTSCQMNLIVDSEISGHRGEITSCDFGPRERFASASSDHTVRLWNYDSGNICYKEATPLSPIAHHSYR